MPELPEVESYARALHAAYAEQEIAAAIFYRDDIRFPLDLLSLHRCFASGSRLLAVRRVGKALYVMGAYPHSQKTWCVEIGLGMTGAFIAGVWQQPARHEHVSIQFRSGDVLGFVDPRRFGFMRVCQSGEPPVCVDALSQTAVLQVFEHLAERGSRREIKAVLLDQTHFPGMGNIYASEVLHRVGIHPARLFHRLSEKERKALAHAIPKLFEQAIAAGGSSVATYRRLNGSAGSFQTLHRVYARAGKACMRARCSGVIERWVHGGRSSFFCPQCQF